MHQQTHPHKIHSHNSLTKTAIAVAISIGLNCNLTQVNAALPAGALLNFEPGTPILTGCSAGNFTGTSCTIGGTPYTAFEVTDMGGSYFLMDQGQGNADKIAISQFAPLEIGAIQTSSGQHTGTVDGSESPAIDNAWNFFMNTGMHNNSAPITVSGNGNTLSLDMAGWGVNWGEFGPGSANATISMPGTASLVCETDCSDGETYTLDMDVHVPVAFTSVPYSLHMEGVIEAPVVGGPPVAEDDVYPEIPNTIVGNKVTLDVLSNDKTPSDAPFLFNTLAPVTPTSQGGTTARVTTNSKEPGYTEVDYTPAATFADDNDTFTYTINNANGPSNPSTVTVNVQTNVAPEAGDDLGGDGVSTNTAALTNAINSPDGGIIVKVLLDDTDANNDDDLPGGIDTSSVTVIDQPAIGTCTKNPAGTITYSQALPVVPTQNDSCTYQVNDIDNTNAPLTSNVATVDINVSELQSDWPPSLDPDIIPFLVFEDGVPNKSGNTADPPESGTYFTMDVSATTTIHTTLIKGPDGGLIIGYDQIATGSHTGVPIGNETASVDLGWNFFGNTGLTFTKNGGITGNTDGTLKFSGEPSVNDGQGKYQITWNGIPEIDLGGSDKFPDDLGFALISCNPAPCADGSTYDLIYAAHVPPGDPSGFGGVQYKLFMDGTVVFLDGSFQTSSGRFDVEERSQAGDAGVEPDPDSEIQCAGGCFDYTIIDITDPSVSVVLPLNGGVPASTLGDVQLRVFRDGAWGNFDTSGNDSVMSAPFTSGGDFGTTCPPPGDAAYGALTEGHQCLQVTIEDNGPNDKNGTDHEITDPSGLGIPTIVQGPDTRTSGTSGCTVASTTVSPLHGGAWWLLAGLASLIGWKRRQSKLH